MQALLLSLVALFAVSVEARAACDDDPAALVAVLEQATMDGRFEAADQASDALVASFGCGGPADRAVIARLWLSRAVLAAARGDDAAADDALAAAARVSPGTWNEMYGPTLRQRWEQSAARPVAAYGRLRLDPLPGGAVSAVDGERLDLPADLAAGLHLLQVGPSARDFAAAQIFYLPPGLELVLDPGLPSAPPPPVPTRRPIGSTPRSRRVLAGLGVGVAAAALYGVSFATNAAFYDQPDGGRTAARQRLNNGLVVGSAGLAAVSGVLLVSGLAAAP
ncbi:MAG: hypothetical protein R3F59_03665 [Myxococcota bacterium]